MNRARKVQHGVCMPENSTGRYMRESSSTMREVGKGKPWQEKMLVVRGMGAGTSSSPVEISIGFAFVIPIHNQSSLIEISCIVTALVVSGPMSSRPRNRYLPYQP